MFDLDEWGGWAVSSEASPRVPMDEIDFDEELVYTYRGELFTGVAYEESVEHGLSETSFRDGKQNGAARDWSPNGQILRDLTKHY